MRSSLPLSWPAFLISLSRRLNRHSAEHRNPFAEHLERHPDRALAAFAPDPGITLGLELGDGAGVCHPDIKARSERVGKSSYSLGLKIRGPEGITEKPIKPGIGCAFWP